MHVQAYCDLSKNLNDKFKFTYRINGKEFECDEKMEYSNRELFKFVVCNFCVLHKTWKITFANDPHQEYIMYSCSHGHHRCGHV